jgi:hypothetical protein
MHKQLSDASQPRGVLRLPELPQYPPARHELLNGDDLDASDRWQLFLKFGR